MSQIMRWGWIGLLVVAVVMRLSGLNAAPLTSDELTQVLPALTVMRGGGWPAVAHSPLLLMGNALLFFFFGPGEGIARFLPALAGGALVALPWFWRRWLGEVGALAAAACLAFSPLALAAARHADPAVFGALGGLLCLTVFFSGEPWNPRQLLALGVAGVALGLNGGPAFYDGLFAGLLAWLAYRWTWGDRTALSGFPVRAIGLGLGAAWLISIAGGLWWGGWAGPVQGLIDWGGGWVSPVRDIPAPFLYGLYEPALLFLAVVAVVNGVQKGRPLPIVLGLWGLLTALLLTLRPGAHPLTAVAALPPLALLAGWGVQVWFTELEPGQWRERASYTAGSLLLWLILGLTLAHYSVYGPSGGSQVAVFGVSIPLSGVEYALMLLLVLFQLFLWVGVGRFLEMPAVSDAVGLATFGILALLQLSFGWGNTFVRPESPAELLTGRTVASADLRNLREDLGRWVQRRGLWMENFSVTVVGEDAELVSAVRWALRDWPAVEVSPAWPADELPAGLVVAPEAEPPPEPLIRAVPRPFTALDRIGVQVPACTAGTPPSCAAPVAWYLYRRPFFTPQRERVAIWEIP